MFTWSRLATGVVCLSRKQRHSLGAMYTRTCTHTHEIPTCMNTQHPVYMELGPRQSRDQVNEDYLHLHQFCCREILYPIHCWYQFTTVVHFCKLWPLNYYGQAYKTLCVVQPLILNHARLPMVFLAPLFQGSGQITRPNFLSPEDGRTERYGFTANRQ